MFFDRRWIRISRKSSTLAEAAREAGLNILINKEEVHENRSPQLDLKEKVVYINQVTQGCLRVVENFRFSALVVVGDENGHVGVGMGKSIEIPVAIKKGIEDARNT